MNVIGIDIGGTNFRIGAVNGQRQTVKFEKVPVETVFHSGDAMADLTAAIQRFANGLAYEAVAIGFPATMNANRSRVVQAPNIPFMEDLPVCEVLQRTLGVPVMAERDVTYALCYDMDKYHIPACGVTCGIYFGTGIGNAIAIDGNFLTGQHGAAGELGHIPVPGCTIPCGCGNVGCLETVAGGKALARLQQESFPDTPIGEVFTRHGGEPAIKELVDLMAVAVATEVNLLDPAHVLLGGGVLNMQDFPKAYFTERILARTRKPLPQRELSLLFTEDERDKSVVGGAVYARKKLNL